MAGQPYTTANLLEEVAEAIGIIATLGRTLVELSTQCAIRNAAIDSDSLDCGFAYLDQFFGGTGDFSDRSRVRRRCG